MSNHILLDKNLDVLRKNLILDVSPTMALGDGTDKTLSVVEDDFMKVSLAKKYTTGTYAYPIRSINSESSNLLYLGNDTIDKMYGCNIAGKSTITISYKVTRIKPYAFLIRVPLSHLRYATKVTIVGCNHNYLDYDNNTGITTNKTTYTPIAMLTGITSNILRSGIFYYEPQGNNQFFDEFILWFSNETSSSYNTPAIGTLKILGECETWNSRVEKIYNTHLLSLFKYARDNASPALGQVSYENPITEIPIEQEV